MTTTTCPMEAVFGGGDEERYPCTYTRGHEGPHSYEGVNPPSVADLTFNPGDEVIAQYGALLDENGEPMVAKVLHEVPGSDKGYVLIRYRCPDGSATDNFVEGRHLVRAHHDA